ncbi:hypothetical protein GGG16DRAFT_63130 [Schizophyllum commune]
MIPERAHSILRRALQEHLDHASVLSQLLTVFFHERLQPADPDYVSESACRELLRKRSDVHSLLQSAIREQDCQRLWDCDFLAFAEANLQSQKAQSPTDMAIDTCIADFERTHKKFLLEYAKGNEEPYPVWRPSNESSRAPEDYSAFIHSLRIPSASSNRPSLLLHELGDRSHTIDHGARLRNIFRAGESTMLMNALGTGKTRLLFEGLCEHWGLYIACTIKNAGLGSCDLTGGLKQVTLSASTSKALSGASSAEEADDHAEATRDLADRIMLARLTIFKLFLESLPELKDIRTCRRRWLLLQLSSIHLSAPDLFANLVDQLDTRHATASFVQHRISDTLLKIRAFIGRDEPIFCVLDDAQRLIEYYADNYQPSTALHAVLRSWETFPDLTLILSGLPFELDCPTGATPYRLCTDTGSFNSRERQIAYVRHYLPPSLRDSIAGRKLLTRIYLWFRGRYRPTASLIHCLLEAYFLNPHTVLTAYVATYAGIEPSDAVVEEDSMVRGTCNRLVAGLGGFHPVVLLRYDLHAWFTLHMAVHRMSVLQEAPVKVLEDCLRIARRAFAFISKPDGTEATVDEPTYVFPLVKALFVQCTPAEGFLCDTSASRLTTVPKHKAVHLGAIPLLILALKEPRKLSDLFAFARPHPPWAGEICSLVRVTSARDDGKPLVTPFTTSWPHEGNSERWATESAQWLQSQPNTPEPFCVATRFSHADLLFNLQLGDGTVILVVLKFVLKNEHIAVTTQEMENCIARLAPDRLFGERVSLGGTPVQDVARVLRVVATYPDQTDVATIPQDGQTHPVAVLNIDLLRDLAESVNPVSVIRRVHYCLITKRRIEQVGDEVPRVLVDEIPPSA